MNIRQVRKKIRSVVNVQKITKAMELVSAIKMKKAQRTAYEGRPYKENLDLIIQKITKSIDPKFSPLIFIDENEIKNKKDLVIFISSNKGLCGAYNFNLFRFLNKEIDFKNCDFISVGKKGASFISKLTGQVLADYSTIYPLDSVSAIFNKVLELFLNRQNKSVILIYNKFINTLKYEPVKEILLPLNYQIKSTQILPLANEYLIEPSPEQIIDSLLKSFVEEKIRRAIIESEASEHSARMIAMKNANDNARDLIYNLTLLRNKLRQEKITYELLDIVTSMQSVELT